MVEIAFIIARTCCAIALIPTYLYRQRLKKLKKQLLCFTDINVTLIKQMKLAKANVLAKMKKSSNNRSSS
ncbi:MAG: hypothetical protein ACLTOX_01655 [Streptococcus thermophilus]